MKASRESAEADGASKAAAASRRPRDALTNLHFVVGVEGMQSGGAFEVLIPAARIVELPRKRREVQYEPLVIRRGLTDASEWYDWWNAARRRTAPQRRKVVVRVESAGGRASVEWAFRDCVPIAYSVSPLHALLGEPLLESLELRVGGFELIRHE
jgi:phage tail-like protein